MNNINLNNYEQYIIDYFDNQLSAEQVAELMVFLETNPLLKKEFELLENFTPINKLDEHSTFSFKQKDKLKKPEYSKEEIYQAFVNELEGNITKTDTVILNNLPLQTLNIEREWFKKTKLQPDLTLIFDKKYKLRKHTKLISLNFYRTAGIAASVLFMLGITLWKLYFTSGNNSSNPVNLLQNASNKVNTLLKPVATTNIAVSKLSNHADKHACKKSAQTHTLTKIPKLQKNKLVLSEPSTEIVSENNKPFYTSFEQENGSNLDSNVILADFNNISTAKEIAQTEISANVWAYKNITEQQPQQAAQNRWLNLVQLAAGGIEKLTGKKTSIHKINNDCETIYHLKFGALEIEHTVACK